MQTKNVVWFYALLCLALAASPGIKCENFNEIKFSVYYSLLTVEIHFGPTPTTITCKHKNCEHVYALYLVIFNLMCIVHARVCALAGLSKYMYRNFAISKSNSWNTGHHTTHTYFHRRAILMCLVSSEATRRFLKYSL